MRSILCKMSLISIVLALSLAVSRADTISFSDGFEGATIDPFWTVTEQFGTVGLSTDQAHTGEQSAKFSSTDGGQREMHLVHHFGATLTGHASIYFYDVAPRQETLYELFELSNSTQPSPRLFIGTQDFDAFCYTAALATPQGGFGPNANCGVFPQTSTTDVPRTVGWHRLEIAVGAGSGSFSIDNNAVYTFAGNYTFDTVDIHMSGPFWRPNTVAYFDDFNIVASSAQSVPEPATLLLLCSGLTAVWILRRRGGVLLTGLARNHQTALAGLLKTQVPQALEPDHTTRCHVMLLSFLLLFTPSFLVADVITFEGLPDSTVLTTQYPDLTFSNAIILTAGLSLNEFEFPPHSGVNVASDNGGLISIIFASPIVSFGGYFTYAEPLTLEAFDSGNNLLASATSAFSNNEALSGGAGSSPNEFLQVMFAGGVSRVSIAGDAAGGSFALDDATFNPLPTSAVPEPASWSLFLLGGVLLALFRGLATARLPN